MVSSFLSVAVIKHCDPKQSWERKGFVWLTLGCHSPPLREVRAGRRHHGVTLLAGSLPDLKA